MTRIPSPARRFVRVSLAAATLVGVTSTPLVAQIAVPRFVIASGGGTSSAGPYAVEGTAGQSDAGSTLSGGPYSIAGGFWSFAGTDGCSFIVTPLAQAVVGAGANGNVSITASAANCAWTAASHAAWIAITSGANGVGNGSVAFAVALNATAAARSGTVTIAGQTFTVTQSALPTMALSASQVNFGAIKDGAGVLTVQTPGQALTLTQGGAGPVTWTATANAPWISVSPASGSGPGVITVSISNADQILPASGVVSGTVTIATSGAANAPSAGVTLTVLAPATNTTPRGVFETPADGQGDVTGSIPVTGWAIDDVGVTRVRVTRAPVGGEGNSQIFIGDAIFVTGARPDVAAANPAAPYFERAGWGYLLLTNFLPNQGNGTFTLYAYAEDVEGHSILLGSKTITCTNAAATRPFGAIDTPAQGGTASGRAFVNFGWALTPNPKSIPADGSTIQVYIDSIPIGTLDSYDNRRPDIQALFPGRANTDGAVGLKTIDTTALSNGVHTIAWIVFDNAGAGDGIGSRFFIVSNSDASAVAAPAAAAVPPAGVSVTSPVRNVDASSALVGIAGDLDETQVSDVPLTLRRGFDETSSEEMLVPDAEGVRRVRVAQLERVRIDLSTVSDGDAADYRGFERTGGELRTLPVGATLDPVRGIFTWAPGLAFGGTRSLVFLKSCAHRVEQVRIDVTVAPR